jgi:hypothetical protein
MTWGIWEWIRGRGGNPENEADLREEFGPENPEFGRKDPGEAEEQYLEDTGYGAPMGYGGGLAAGDAADVAAADLDEFKPPRDPAP